MEEESDLVRFSWSYEKYHGYISTGVCMIGVCCNLINIVVLTRPTMRNTTNLLLTVLAVSDLLTMASYIPFALQFYILHGLRASPERNTQSWMIFFVFHVNFTVTTHTISIWLGVLLSIFRYSYITLPRERNYIYSMVQVRRAILSVVFGSILILIPNYMSLSIIKIQNATANGSSYHVLRSLSHETTLGVNVTVVNFWIHAILIKLLPCALMLFFGCLLISTLRNSKRKRTELRRRSTISLTSKKRSIRTKEHSRTTFMLLVVIILFLVTELPQGILALCSGLREGFFDAYYIPLGDIMDIVALLNNGINFTLYCSMSKKFRKTFLRLFLPILSTRKLSTNTGGCHLQVSKVHPVGSANEDRDNVPLTAMNANHHH